MTTVSYPGVYVEEIPGGARTIESAGTSTAAFVGVTERGPESGAQRVTSWGEYQKQFGSFTAGSYLAESVYSFFNNGGRQCYVVRVAPTDALLADLTLRNRATPPVENALKFTAKDRGSWANSLLVTIEDATADPGNGFKISIRRQPVRDVVPENFIELPVLESHDNLVMDPQSPNYAPTVIGRDSSLIDLLSMTANSSLQLGFHRGEKLSSTPPTLLAEKTDAFLINIDGDGYQKVILSKLSFDKLEELAAEVTSLVQKLTPRKTSTSATAFTAFKCEIKESCLVLRSGGDGLVSSVRVQSAADNGGAKALGLGDKGISEDAFALRRPASATVLQLGDNAKEGVVTALPVAGTDGTISALTVARYREAFSRLDAITDCSLLCVPGVPKIEANGAASYMIDEGAAYCANRPLQDMFYIGEVDEECDTATEAQDFRKGLTKANSYGALYFPWVKAPDPSGRKSGAVRLPPSGFIAGLYARIDATRGVWKAPAGTEASLNGVTGLAATLTDTQQGVLNPISVNVLRRFDLSGIVSWGARTVSSDPEWKYVPVRRTAIMIRRSIYDGIQWAVFEPNDHRLWSALRTNIGAFMNNLFRAGAFQGEKANDAYFVRCGLGDTMVQDDIDRGQVIVMVGFAPLKPAEFVIVRIQQKAGQQ